MKKIILTTTLAFMSFFMLSTVNVNASTIDQAHADLQLSNTETCENAKEEKPEFWQCYDVYINGEHRGVVCIEL